LAYCGDEGKDDATLRSGQVVDTDYAGLGSPSRACAEPATLTVRERVLDLGTQKNTSSIFRSNEVYRRLYPSAGLGLRGGIVRVWLFG
jgi:hypothetical protein